MLKDRASLLLMGAGIGAIVGLGIAWVATDAQKQQDLLLADGAEKTSIRPRAKDWVTFGVAAVTLVRQLSDILEPKT